MSDTLFLLLYWTGPIGVGAFLAGLGVLIYLIAKANAISKSLPKKEKGKE